MDLSNDEMFIQRIKTLNETIWEHKAKGSAILDWLGNFCDEKEKSHALYLLSKFIYFGERQIKEMLKALYRDLYKYPIIEKIRKDNADVLDIRFINDSFAVENDKTRFLGMGNPSESGAFLLYYFRQINNLRKNLFVSGHEIFMGDPSSGSMKIMDDTVQRYVFIDDFCGSGRQAVGYAARLVYAIKRLNPSAKTYYFSLFGTEKGLNRIRKRTCFDQVASVSVFDSSFKCFEKNSRYFLDTNSEIQRDYAKEMCKKYGMKWFKDYPNDLLGFDDGQLLLGFRHNIPDNTIPIIWQCEDWQPIFLRYQKIYGG